MVKRNDLDILVCPICKSSELKIDILSFVNKAIHEGEIICTSCNVFFKIENGIPNMIPPILSLINREDLKLWKKWFKKLRNFERWRKKRYKKKEKGNPEILRNQIEYDRLKTNFFKFCNCIEGDILEIGCGGGWNKEHCQGNYVGIDPIITIDNPDFPFYQAIGEYLPFRNSSFDSIIMTAILDHVVSVDEVIKESFRVLRKGGFIYIQTHVESNEKEQKLISQSDLAPLSKNLIELINRGPLGILKSAYYCLIYSRPISKIRDRYTHMNQIRLDSLLNIIKKFSADSILQVTPDHNIAFIKVKK
ncbi:methyltransferase domain-containing protein [candidate division KSB1 bacterium]|nr:methyltransferase domain-containing protein [candidate division KSB1 bacterium]